MLTFCRGLVAGVLVVGLFAICAAPTHVEAQDKKDAKKDPKKGDDPKDHSIGIGTSDGLTLSGYWYQGVAIEKQRPDAVIMVPAPGNKVNDAWISLAKALSEKNFSVLLFDWRGCGANGPDGAGSRIFEDKEKFWKEFYNQRLLRDRRTSIEDKGLDWKGSLANKSENLLRYRDFSLMNDLLAARFYLDKQSDVGRCNTNRVWIISEKDGAYLGMAFIAAEFQRNSIYDPKRNVFDTVGQFKSAGKDYAGLMALSYSTTGQNNGTAAMVYRNALPSFGANDLVRDAKNHLEDRLAMVLMYSSKEGTGGARSALSLTGVPFVDAEVRRKDPPAAVDKPVMKPKFKYVYEIDNSKINKPITGIDLIGDMDSFGAKARIVEGMVEISKVQNYGKEPTDREAAKMATTPRFEIEKFNRK